LQCALRRPSVSSEAPRRFPPPRAIEDIAAAFVVRDASGQGLACLYNKEEFRFSFEFSAAKRLRFDLKGKQCLKEIENDARGHLNTFGH
jgi:hypothetical protein